MDWQAAFRARAIAASGVTTPLGGQKVYWALVPQGVSRPYVILTDVTELLPQTLDTWDLAFARIQIDVWGDTYAVVQTVMAALITALVPANTGNGHTFQRADVALGPRDVSGETDGTQPIFRKTVDLIIAHA